MKTFPVSEWLEPSTKQFHEIKIKSHISHDFSHYVILRWCPSIKAANYQHPEWGRFEQTNNKRYIGSYFRCLKGDSREVCVWGRSGEFKKNSN